MLWRNSTECSERTHGRLLSQYKIVGTFELKCLSWEINKDTSTLGEKKMKKHVQHPEVEKWYRVMHLKVECEKKKKLFEGVLLKGNRPEVEPSIFMANKAPNDHFDP